MSKNIHTHIQYLRHVPNNIHITSVANSFHNSYTPLSSLQVSLGNTYY
jgi:hypothetical protein